MGPTDTRRAPRSCPWESRRGSRRGKLTVGLGFGRSRAWLAKRRAQPIRAGTLRKAGPAARPASSVPMRPGASTWLRFGVGRVVSESRNYRYRCARRGRRGADLATFMQVCSSSCFDGGAKINICTRCPTRRRDSKRRTRDGARNHNDMPDDVVTRELHCSLEYLTTSRLSELHRRAWLEGWFLLECSPSYVRSPTCQRDTAGSMIE